MPPPPNPVWLYHITAISNLPSIANQGAVCPKSQLTAKGLGYSNVAYQGAQGKRASKIVERHPGGVIHDYVPFYFAPRSPMLFTINNGNVPGCDHRQEDIVHLAATVEDVVKAGLPFVFYNYNATLDYADCFSDISDLDKIDWPLFFEDPKLDGYCKYWKSTVTNSRYALRMETRQAEFLVHGSIPLGVLKGVGTINAAKAAEVSEIFRAASVAVSVKAKPNWYF